MSTEELNDQADFADDELIIRKKKKPEQKTGVTAAGVLKTAAEALEALRAKGPLVQCMTNAVAADSTARALKALGAAYATVEDMGEGSWVCLTAPDQDEVRQVAATLDIEPADLQAALDPEESARVSLEDGYTVIIVDIPVPVPDRGEGVYTTIPLGILLSDQIITTVCSVDTPVLADFAALRVRDFSTRKKMRFVYQILYRAATVYQQELRLIDRRRQEIEKNLAGSSTQDSDLIELHALESTLVYFATSLRANSTVLDRLTRYKRLEQYPDDMELLDDVIVEIRQAIEMTSIYRDDIKGTRELFSVVLDNRLNNTMKWLTSVTLIMAVPTVVSGLYGMHVNLEGMPFAENPFGFGIVCGLILAICISAAWILHKKHML